MRMSAHYTCLQGHAWPVDEGSTVCPVCGARPLAPPSAIVEDEPPRPPEKLMTPRLEVPDQPVVVETRAGGGWSSATVGMLAAMLVLLLLIAGGLGWIAMAARDDAANKHDAAVAAEKAADDNAAKALAQAQKAEKSQQEALDQKKLADEQRKAAEENQRNAQEQVARLKQQEERQRYLTQIARVESIWEREPLRASRMLDQCPERDRDFCWGFYKKLCTAELATFPGHEDPVSVVAISPNGKLAASVAGKAIKVWDLVARKEIATLTDHTQPIHELLFAPDSKKLASRCDNAGKKGELFLWDVSSAEKVTCKKLEGHRVPVTGMMFARDGKVLVSCSGESNDLENLPQEAKVWNPETGNELKSFPIPERGQGFFSIAISPDGKTFAAGGGGTAGAGAIHVVDVDSGRSLQTLKGQNGWITALAFADNSTLISGTRGSENPTVRIWNLDNGKDRATFTMENEKDGIVAVRVLGDAKTIAAWTRIQMKMWDIETGVPRSLALTGPFWSPDALAFSADGATLAVPHKTVGKTVEVMFWDVPTARDRGSFSQDKSDFDVVAFAPDGQTMLTGWNHGTLRVLNAATVQESSSFKAHQPAEEQRTVLAISPDGKYVATGGADRVVRLWPRAGGDAVELKGHEAPITSLAFWQPDQRLLLISADRIDRKS